jgi:hypothetical protein
MTKPNKMFASANGNAIRSATQNNAKYVKDLIIV